MALLTISVDRSSLSLPALVFADPASGLWLPEDGLGRPAKHKRREYPSESKYLEGSTLISSTTDQATVPIKSFYVARATQADLEAACDEIEEAFDQFNYAMTVTLNGHPRTWSCDPADVDWDDFDSGLARVYMYKGSITVPVFPRSS